MMFSATSKFSCRQRLKSVLKSPAFRRTRRQRRRPNAGCRRSGPFHRRNRPAREGENDFAPSSSLLSTRALPLIRIYSESVASPARTITVPRVTLRGVATLSNFLQLRVIFALENNGIVRNRTSPLCPHAASRHPLQPFS